MVDLRPEDRVDLLADDMVNDAADRAVLLFVSTFNDDESHDDPHSLASIVNG